MRPGDVGSIPIECANFDEPVSLGYLDEAGNRERVRTPPQLVSWPSSISLGRTQTVIVVQPVERPARTGKQQVRILPNQNSVRMHLSNGLPFVDGSQHWVILDKDVVAGSSPAFGYKCRSSSVVEHVIPSSFLIRRSFQRVVDGGLPDH